MAPHNTLQKLSLACLLAGAATLAAAAPVLPQETPGAAHIEQSNVWLEIDHKVFESNLAALQKHLDGKTQICAVMKADAYGHGIALLMPSILRMNIPCVGVTSNAEARVARAKGFTGRLMRLRNATPGEVEGALPWQLEELVGSQDSAQVMNDIARRHGQRIAVHVGLNAGGMARNGLEVDTDRGQHEALEIARLEHLKIVGLMTHFALEETEQIREGVKRFQAQTDWLMKEAGLKREDLVLHTANTQATLEVPESWFDLVRPGRVLYGEVGPEHPQYRTFLALKSRVASVNAYPKGAGVGYGHTRTLERDSLLANIPVGYSDGFRRILSNQASVLVRGQRAPMLGTISMNTFMVDVTDIDGVQAGDEVVLFGKQGSSEITQAELEKMLGVFLAENYTVWSTANPRVLKTPE